MPDKDLIFIIDVQAAFSIPPKVLSDIETFSRGFKRRILTKFVNPPGSLFRTVLHRDACAPGSPDLRLLIPIRPRDLVFNKQGYGLGHHHLHRLRKMKVKTVDVCGIDTDACVLGVMFSLFDAGIMPRVHPHLRWSSQGLNEEALKVMEHQFGARKLSRKRAA